MTAVRASFAEVYASALRGEVCQVIGLGTAPQSLPVHAWVGRVDGDEALLAQCRGACIDIGCGPGRMTESLAVRGHVVLGVDLVAEAVFQTRDRGAGALLRDVFDPLPGEGRWQTALLADGNIGIGGDPSLLLSRVADLLVEDGRVVVDLEPPGTGVVVRHLRLATRSLRSGPFPWAVVGVDAIEPLATSAGFAVPQVHRHADRWFAVLEKAR